MANTFSLIEAQTLSSNQSTVTLGAGGTIPSTYTDLRVIITARTDRAANNDFIKGYFNTDTTDANYIGVLAWGGGSGSGNYATFAGAGAPRYLGDCTANTAPTYMFSNNEIYIPNYTSSVAKAYYGDAVTNNSASSVVLSMFSGTWSGTAAINKLTFTVGVATVFLSGSSFYLYGIVNQ